MLLHEPYWVRWALPYQGIWVNAAHVFSMDPTLRAMWPDGQQDITEVTKRPLTAGTLFKNSMVALVENLASKVLPFQSFSVPWAHIMEGHSLCLNPVCPTGDRAMADFEASIVLAPCLLGKAGSHTDRKLALSFLEELRAKSQRSNWWGGYGRVC